jgi:hypothetical protein
VTPGLFYTEALIYFISLVYKYSRMGDMEETMEYAQVAQALDDTILGVGPSIFEERYEYPRLHIELTE